MPESHDPTFADVFAGDLFTGMAIQQPDTEPVALDPDQVFADTADPVGSHVNSGKHEPRFDGDTSELSPEVCWALQELVATPHVSEKSKKKHWAAVLQYEDLLRARLSELGLFLEINHEYRYAFTRQGGDPSPHSRTILRAKTLSLAASTLALHLYHQYVMSPDDPVVETTDMVDHMMGYKQADDTDEAAFQKKIKAAISALDDAAIIKPVKGTERYVIYVVITSILTAEQVEALDLRYKAIAAGEISRVTDTDAPTNTETGEDDND